MQGRGSARCGCCEGWKAGGETVVVEQGRELWVGLDGAFVLEITDLEI